MRLNSFHTSDAVMQAYWKHYCSDTCVLHSKWCRTEMMTASEALHGLELAVRQQRGAGNSRKLTAVGTFCSAADIPAASVPSASAADTMPRDAPVLSSAPAIAACTGVTDTV